MIEYFWLDSENGKLAHILENTRIEETPSGTEGDIDNCVTYVLYL